MSREPSFESPPVTPREKRGGVRHLIHARIPYEVYKRLVAYCARRGVTLTAVVTAALEQYLDQASDNALIMRRLDRLGREAVHLQRQVELLTEFLSVWLQMWLAHTPELPGDQKQQAQLGAMKRFHRMIEYLTDHMAGTKRFLTDQMTAEADDEPISFPRGPKSDLPQ